MADRAVCTHEATHAACAVWMRRHVDHVIVHQGSFLGDEVMGYCRIPIEGVVEASQVPIALCGYMAVDEPGWPPDYEDALDEEREALGTIILGLGLDREAYENF